MIYVGVAAWLLDIDMEEIQKAVVKQFKARRRRSRSTERRSAAATTGRRRT